MFNECIQYLFISPTEYSAKTQFERIQKLIAIRKCCEKKYVEHMKSSKFEVFI